LRIGTSVRVEAFEYPASTTPPSSFWEDLPEVGFPELLPEGEGAGEYPHSDSESQQAMSASAAELAARSFEEGREQGIREARESAANEQRAVLQEAENQRVEQAASLATQFANNRDRFFRDVEAELVRLALAIAARILRREAQMDPLFLIGAVRVALGQLATTTQVRLRIPAAEFGLWTETLAHIPNLRVKPTVIPDNSMQLGDCLVETEMGSVDLSLPAQLHQIEIALLDETASTCADISADLHPQEREVNA
jgi:flagellar assembly protein FliH